MKPNTIKLNLGGSILNKSTGIKLPAFNQKPPQQIKPQSSLSTNTAGNIFGDDDDDSSNTSEDVIKAVNAKLMTVTKTHGEPTNLVDPSIYDYDASYDEMAEKRRLEKEALEAERNQPGGPRYMQDMKQLADLRKRESQLMKDRMMIKERQKEDKLYEGAPRIVTNAYKRKLEEDKRLLEELDERDNVGIQDTKRSTHQTMSNNTQISSSNPTVGSSATAAVNPNQNTRVLMNDAPQTHDTSNHTTTQTTPDSKLNDIDANNRVEEDSHPHPVPPTTITTSTTLPELSEADWEQKMIKQKETNLIDKVDKMSSAKERYLARKRSRLIE